MARTQIHGGTQIKTGTITGDRIASATIALDRLAVSVATPSDVATAVANAVQGWDWKQSVDYASTTNVTIASVQAGSSFGGGTLAEGDRVLLKDQSNAAENGIYDVNTGSGLTRSADADSNTDVTPQLTVRVEAGTHANTGWTLTNTGSITLGTTELEFTQIPTSSGSGTVTEVSGEDANGFTVDVEDGTTTPAITVGTSITGLLKGDGEAVAAATAGSDYLAPGNVVTRETPSGNVNGSNTEYTLANTPVAGSEQVFLNGLLQEPGGEDYTISSATITFVSAPTSGDRIRVSYLKG